MLDDLCELCLANAGANPGFVGVVVPGFDSGRDEKAVGVFQTLQLGSAQNGEGTLDDVGAAFFLRDLFNDAQHLVELHAEIRVMVGHVDPRPVSSDAPKIGFQQLRGQNHIRVVPVHTKVATVRAAHAAEQRHNTHAAYTAPDQGCGHDLRHPFFYAGDFLQWPAAGHDCVPVETSPENVVD